MPLNSPPNGSHNRLDSTLIRTTELGDGSPHPHSYVAPLVASLRRVSPRLLSERQSRIDELAAELGVHFSSDGHQLVGEKNWQLDLIPRVIAPHEWQCLERGLIQRARAFNRLIQDLYGQRRILKEEVLPYRIIYDDPAFLLACHGIEQPDGAYITLGAVDLVRDRAGKWSVTANHYALPVGLSFVLQNRRMLSQAFPEIFQSIPIQPVTPFSSDLVETLAALSPEPSPLIVVLTRAGQQNNLFEETFLARRMGVPLVEPGDLLVRQNRVYLKTVAGLERVNVIYRRIPSRGIDPVSLPSPDQSGVPGLLNCVRKNTVALVNAVGSGIADNKALLPYSDTIIRYYLGEAPILPTARTYWCADPDQLEFVRSRLGSMLLKPLHRQDESGHPLSAAQRASYLKEMEALLDSNPAQVVAQPFIDASTCPRFQQNGIVARPAYLRAFCLLGASDRVLPGGLTRQALASESHHYIADLAGGAKDTWIPVDGATTPPQRSRRALVQARRRAESRTFRATSRVGEHLYWMGRYLERAETTSRMVRVLVEQGWEALTPRERRNVWPLWQGLSAATAHEPAQSMKAPPEAVLPIARDLVLNHKQPGSVLACIERAQLNASEILEFLTPEVWSAITHTLRGLQSVTHKNRIAANRLQDVCLYATNEIARINGTISRTMPHDDGWECCRTGILLERAFGTVTVLAAVLPKAILSVDPRRDHDPDLTTLLRMLGSLDAYQREYRSRTYLRQTADLLWKNRETPSSLAYCLAEMAGHLAALEKAPASTEGSSASRRAKRSPLRRIQRLFSLVRNTATTPLFPRRTIDSDMIEIAPRSDTGKMARRVKEFSKKMILGLTETHDLLEDVFFSHLSATPLKFPPIQPPSNP